MTLYDYLLNNGIDEETASNNVLLWEWELPATTNKIEHLCWEWWNDKYMEGRKRDVREILECAKNKTN